ncbi:MAG: phosphatidate cytidylyltransferase [Planctomycetota bacterium]|nr:phosphatidate cytidylyltransferase [Planctomycetota bacterium]
MLGWRLTISAILVPALIGLFVLDHKAGVEAPYLCALCALLAVRAAWEFADLLTTRNMQPSFRLIAICSVAIIGATWFGNDGTTLPGGAGSAMIAFGLSVLAVFLRSAIRYQAPGQSMETLGADLLGIAYVGGLLSITAQLRWVAGADAGYLVLASLVIAAKSGDIGAYTLGRLFGKRKMVPRLSPGKTWMGGLGAVLGASFGSWAWLHWGPSLFFEAPQPIPWVWTIVFGAIIGVVGLIGDLAESLIKRDCGKKDSASLLPGFGGLLDLLDSVIYAGPVAYVLWTVLPLKTW